MDQSSSKFFYWGKQQSLLHKVYKVGFEKYRGGISDISQAFQISDRSIRCIDEGTVGGLHIAGSGILLDQKELEQVIEVMKPDGIYSHAGCGAAALYAREKRLDISRSDEYGKEFCEKIEATFRVPYRGHIDFFSLRRPQEFHIARVVYYDGTGSFDPSRCEALPDGFVVSRCYLSASYAQKEVALAISIAFGKHGFGDLFTSFQPFVLIAVGHSKDRRYSVRALKQELYAVSLQYGDRVVVDGF